VLAGLGAAERQLRSVSDLAVSFRPAN